MKTNLKNLNYLAEWATWAHLDSKTDLELILLKGHLILENIVEISIKRLVKKDLKKHSFYSKVEILDKINLQDNLKKDFIISSLKTLNSLRNKLAHDFYFDINNGEFNDWSENILENLNGTKYTRYTYRTKIIHSFSIISKNLLDLSIDNTYPIEGDNT